MINTFEHMIFDATFATVLTIAYIYWLTFSSVSPMSFNFSHTCISFDVRDSADLVSREFFLNF